ncbi:MAG: protein kinase [Candidatus Melainabacteria bacterium]|nr:protein kinase [Candidatus Melainabacteria bacterium]
MPEFNENPRPRPPDPYVGRVIDKYTLVSKLGTGGMGLVYRAEQLRIKRHVAIKLLSAKLIHDQVNVKRIEREAAAMGNLRHPNIATFHDFGISDGQPYLVMELISGRSFGEVIDEQKRLHPERVIKIAAQVADAMAYAHKQGLIHRDLKPDNIMLDDEHTDDYAKVLDFGIAKSAEDLSLTQSGVLIGSPLYMSPEQCRGGKLDYRSDIYSLGVIIYEAVTGLVPCKGETLIETLSRKTMEQAPPFPPGFSDWTGLEQLTLACLATEPEDRPQSMALVRDALFGLLSPGSVSMSISSLHRPRNPGASGAGAAMGGSTQNQTQGDIQDSNIDSPESQTRTTNPFVTRGQPGRTTQTQSRSTAGRSARGRTTQSQTRSQQGQRPPVLDETGQIYRPVISSKQMIVIGSAVGAMYLMSMLAVGTFFVFNSQHGILTSILRPQTTSTSNASGGSVSASPKAPGTAGSGNANSSTDVVGATAGVSPINLPWNKNQSKNTASTRNVEPVDTSTATSKPQIKPTAKSKPAAQVVRTAQAKTKPSKLKEQVSRQQSVPETRIRYRYGSSSDNVNSQVTNSSFSNQSATTPSNSATNSYSGDGYETNSVARTNRVARQRLQADREVKEHRRLMLQAAMQQRQASIRETAAAREASAANVQRVNDLDASRRQFGGGSQWGKDTGSQYYGGGGNSYYGN